MCNGFDVAKRNGTRILTIFTETILADGVNVIQGFMKMHTSLVGFDCYASYEQCVFLVLL